MSLSAQAKKLSLKPGVYLFLNQKGVVLYVGRAISLRKRVLNYFQKDLDPRIREMVAKSYTIKSQRTDNLLEAIVLEANLIKKHWPKYNIRDRDDRSFVYIVIPKTDYPRPFIVRQRELKVNPGRGAEVFGPYKSIGLLEAALRILRRIFPYSTCKPESGRPCFDYQIGLCPGACIGAISKEDYEMNIDNLVMFLKGEKKRLLKKLEKENPVQAESLKHIQDVALISKEDIYMPFTEKITRVEGYDISHLTGKETFGSMVSFLNGMPNKKYYRLFRIKEAPANDDLRALEEMIIRRLRHPEWPLADLILIDGGKPQIDYVSKVLDRLKANIPIAGISKFSNDKLVFPPKMKKTTKNLLITMKPTLLKVRNEAHRFALKSSRYRRRIGKRLEYDNNG